MDSKGESTENRKQVVSFGTLRLASNIKRSQKDKVRQNKKRRKYCLKSKKKILRYIGSGFKVFLGEATKCLDCGRVVGAARLGCGVCQLINMEKGVAHGVSLIVKVGNGMDSALARETVFLSFADLQKEAKKGVRFMNGLSGDEFHIVP